MFKVGDIIKSKDKSLSTDSISILALKCEYYSNYLTNLRDKRGKYKYNTNIRKT